MDDQSDVPTDGLMAYDTWIDEALRSVVLRALTFVQQNGLLGDHHIYLTFKTSAPGVGIAGYLRAQHPDEMTIVLQHQFTDLTLDDHIVGVTLRFSGKPERLVVPFAAITGFADPSVNFGLQLKPNFDGANDVGPDELQDLGLDVVDADLEADEPRQNDAAQSSTLGEGDGEKPEGGSEGGNVVTLDAFRKT